MIAFATKAYAKINPFLAVGALREDGYHAIETIFQAIELHDVVSVTSADKTEVRCSDTSLDGEANIVNKALRLCSEVYKLPPILVHIEKHIPTKAGLGGGSSDAAAALKIVDRISSSALRPHLMSIALACGSDVPFFLGDSTLAMGKGRGEKLEPLPTESEQPLVLAMPVGIDCPTSTAYAQLDAIPERPIVRPEFMPYNDFERVAPCESLDLIDRLRSFSIEKAGLCGSGSAVYGFTSDANEIAERLRREGYWAVATHTISKFGEPWTL